MMRRFLTSDSHKNGCVFYLAMIVLAVIFWLFVDLHYDRTDVTVWMTVALLFIILVLLILKKEAYDPERTDRFFAAVFMIAAFVYLFLWAWTIPYNHAPDEESRYKIVNFIVNHHALPTGFEEEVRDPSWGISYAFKPILAYIFSAFFEMIAMAFTNDGHLLLIAARLTSVICGTLTVFWMWKIGRELFPKSSIRYLLPVITLFHPQLSFIGAYVNNDSLAMMSSAMIFYFWFAGLDSGFRLRHTVGLAVGIGLCSMSYYNAYGYILLSIPVFYFGLIRAKRNVRTAILYTVTIIMIVFALSGWWFIRAYILYDGDFLGLRVVNELAEKYAQPAFKPSLHITPQKEGISVWEMLTEKGYLATAWPSFIGDFGYMNVPLSHYQYIFYQVGIFTGLVLAAEGYVRREIAAYRTGKSFAVQRFKILIMIAAMVIPFALAVYYSYASDFEPQGRYFLPLCVPLFTVLCYGFNEIEVFQDHFQHRYEKARFSFETGPLLGMMMTLFSLYVFLSRVYTNVNI